MSSSSFEYIAAGSILGALEEAGDSDRRECDAASSSRIRWRNEGIGTGTERGRRSLTKGLGGIAAEIWMLAGVKCFTGRGWAIGIPVTLVETDAEDGDDLGSYSESPSGSVSTTDPRFLGFRFDRDGAQTPPRLRFLITSVFMDTGRILPCSFRNKPQAVRSVG